MAEKILILGGTSEAHALAEKLVAEGHYVTLSLAGRTEKPATSAATIHIGGFGGAQGLSAFLRKGRFTRLVDATHPYAYRISENADQAAELTTIPLQRLDRPPWRKRLGDNWTEFDTHEHARDALPAGATVFLALGSTHIAAFAQRADVRFLIRMVDPPGEKVVLPRFHQIITGKPQVTPEGESDLFARSGVTHLVCRNSGGDAGYAKIEAARRINLPVFMINRRRSGKPAR
jgi:precorrin-6A/cobalt-precorrin-6A reductase